MPVFVIAEVGINHNGDINLAKKLIDGAVMAGADAVKFQKRSIDQVYTKEELDKPRESPWGTTNREQKNGLEFTIEQFKEIDRYCKERKIEWFFSAWDVDSQKAMRAFGCKYNKLASAMLGYEPLIREIISEKKHTYISTGMASMEEIEPVVKKFQEGKCPFELMHCNSTYPMDNGDANLRTMDTLRKKFGCAVGYSGHETGRIVSFAAVVMGASSLERHITLDRAMYGSDQAASLEIADFMRLMVDIRAIEKAMGDGQKRIYPKEAEIRKKLRYYEAKK